MFQLRRAQTAAVLLFAGLGLSLATQQPVMAQSADSEFRDGLKAFEEGEFEQSERHFRNVLKSQPDHAQALRYRDEAGYQFWVKVLARGGRLATVAKRILKAAEKAAIRDRQDQDELRRKVKDLWNDDFMVEIEAVEELVARYGHYVVPELVEVLKDRREDDKRVRAISLLARLGDEGTLAVIELLESDEITLQQNAATVLGHVGDVRAIPALKRLSANSSDAHVKKAAESALSQIKGPNFGTPEYYARVAEAFYQEHPLFMVNRYREHVVWKWVDDALTRRDVARFRWNEEVAEEFAYDGLSVDPDNQILWASLLNTLAQEWTEIEETLRVTQATVDRGDEVDEEEVEKMKELQTKLAKLKMLVSSRGADDVLAALGKAMADQRAPNAVFLIERLQELNIDSSLLATGGTVAYLPAAERDAGAASTPTPPAPAPRIERTPPPARDDPEPTEVPDEDSDNDDMDDEDEAPDLDADEDEDEAPDLDADEDEDEAPDLDADEDEAPKKKKRHRNRRVSQGPTPSAPGTRTRTSRLAYRGAGGVARQDTSSELRTHGSEEIVTGGKALSAALAYGDKRVRYAAAIALAHLNPGTEFANSAQVMTNLIDALGESGQRVILVVERDRHDRNRIVGMLRELGYMTFGVESGRDGLVRAKAFPGEDLILVSSELNPEGEGDDPIEFQFIDSLREDYRTKHIKVMVLTPEERVDSMQSLVDEGRALDVITPDVDKATLSDKLTQAFGGDEDQRDEKARSDAIATRAALAIANLQRGHTVFDITQAATALAKNVRRDSGRPDSVRLACLKALESVGPAGRGAALDILVGEFQDETNSIEVRRALPLAIGEVAKGSAINGDTFDALKAALASDDEGIWKNSGYALGKAKLTGAQAFQVFNEQRLD